MGRFHLYKNLRLLNELSDGEAESLFLVCCSSKEWARKMAAARPFFLIETLYDKAETIWNSLSRSDWIEAIGIGANLPNAADTQSVGLAAIANTGNDEQLSYISAGVFESDPNQVFRLYEEKFGFIFVDQAAEIDIEENVLRCLYRLGNPEEIEIRVAAKARMDITKIKLNRLLEK